MAIKLSEYLIREGLLSQEQLEEALQCQIIFGGRLGTNLVEMNLVKESDVIRCLSNQLERPFVTPEQLMSVPPEIIKLIPKKVAEKFKIIPVSLQKRKLTVAMLHPSDLAAIDAISFMTGYIILPVVSSELRILHALEQHYGIKRELRFITLAGGTGSRTRQAASPYLATRDETTPDWFDHMELGASVDQVKGTCGPKALPVEGTRMPDTAGDNPNRVELPPQSAQNLDLAEWAPVITAPPPTIVLNPEPLDMLSGEVPGPVPRRRDEIAEAITAYVYQNAERVALFLVKERMAVGWKACIRKTVVEGFGGFQLALDEPSVLKVVTESRGLYLGPVPDTADNQKILAALGGGAPESALLMPLMMMDRVVMIGYVDGGKELAAELETLKDKAGMAAVASQLLHHLLFQ